MVARVRVSPLTIQVGQRCVRQLQRQVDQGDQHPIDEEQFVIESGASRPPPRRSQSVDSRCAVHGSVNSFDHIAEMRTIKAAEGRMKQGRAARKDVTIHSNPRGPPSSYQRRITIVTAPNCGPVAERGQHRFYAMISSFTHCALPVSWRLAAPVDLTCEAALGAMPALERVLDLTNSGPLVLLNPSHPDRQAVSMA